jgi:hypothetical protein
MSRIQTGGIPDTSGLKGRQRRRGFSDALSFEISDQQRSPSQVYIDVFGHLPLIVQKLMALRNRLVAPLGFAISASKIELSVEDLQHGQGVGLHKVEMMTDGEIICTTQDKHMQVSLSVVKHAPGQFTLSTLVNTYSWVGYLYLLVIIPFHKLIALGSVRSMLNRVKASR